MTRTQHYPPIIRSIDELLPHVRSLCLEWVKKLNEQGVEPVVVETYRTAERQKLLREEGRSWVKVSWHQLRRAWDAYPRVDGSLCFVYEGKGRAHFDAMGDVARALGIEWGGDWPRLRDFGHFQVTDGLTIEEALKLEATIAAH